MLGIAASRCPFSLVHQSDFPTNYSSSPICSIGKVISTVFKQRAETIDI